MHRSSFVKPKTTARGAVAAAFSVLVLLSMASPAVAQSHCAKWVDRLLDTSGNCVNEPFRDRAHATEVFTWKGHDYMIYNGGNELFIYNVDSAASPVLVAESHFNFGNRGDSDYDLENFDVCDECRYGVFSHKVKRTVVFDLGGGSTPVFAGWANYEASDNLMGGYVFQKGGQEYLFAGGLDGGCGSGSGLYAVNSVSNLEIMSLPCVEVGGSPITVRGLQTYKTAAGQVFLYAGVNGGTVHVFEAVGSGIGMSLDYKSSPVGMKGSRAQLSVDENNTRAASSDYGAGVIRVWNLSDPGNPTEAYTIPAQVVTVSLGSPSANTSSTLVAMTDGAARSTRTWVVDAASAQEFEDTFWSDPALPHNVGPSCVYPVGGALSTDGSVLYLSRYAVDDVFDLSECLAPTPADASLSITPSPVFPGQAIEVRDTSTGRIDRWALWITEEPSGTVVKGSSTLNTTNARTINFTIPKNLAADVSYVAHVEVDSSDLPPFDARDDVTVTIDRTPQASFTIEPSAVVVGDSVTLSATAEGVVGSGGYQWQITDPSGFTVSKNGQVVTHTLNAAGNWDFVLNVAYDHEDPASPPNLYTATDSVLDYAVSSVAADFSWTPANPLHTQQITLDASASKPAGSLVYVWAVASPTHTYNGCASAGVQCVIPPEALNPDSLYSVTLTVWNGPDNSTKIKQMFVGNGAIQPTITWSPTSPEIGQSVLFSIDGVPADIDSAIWTMGGPGCDGADSTPVCTPSLFNDCKSLAYKYSSSGDKTVTLSVVVGENTFPAPPVDLTVQSTGSCGVTPPPPGVCDYTLGTPPNTFGPGGGTSSFSVATTSSCTWVANTTTPWITILSPSGQASGAGAVSFRVGANDGPYRTGTILVGGKVMVINQEAPWVAANFTMSSPRPEIGETVTFAVDPILQVVSWDFGEPDCRGNNPVIDCSFLPTGACNTFQWTFPTGGYKPVKMVLTDGRDQTKGPTVRPVGECCLADGKPDASFEMSADEVYTGETVAFTDTSAKLAMAPAKALGFSWVPANPEIGESVIFTLDGVVGDIDKATWDFGEAGCDGKPAVQECVPDLWNPCTAMTFAFASSGLKPVSVDVEIDSQTETVGPSTVDVANAGSCDGGGGGGCSYSLSDSTASFPFEGGNGAFTVSTTAECAWAATTTASWLDLTSASGTGSGIVNYVVSANPNTAARNGIIRVEGRTHRVTQEGDRGDTAPTSWLWSITRVEDGEGQPVDEDVYTSSDPNTTFTFLEPGLYRVRLTTSNCFGDALRVDYVSVLEAPIEDFVVGAAVSLAGANNTQWESDFRFYNPCDENLDVRLEYQPENKNNADADLLDFREFQLLPNETRIFAHITDAIPGIGADPISGSVKIESSSDSGCKVLSVSRTFNDTPGGSLGLFVPALPVKRVGLEFLDLNGLISNQSYRTNLRLVNYSDEDVWVPLTAYDRNGNQVGQTRSTKVKGQSTKQINEIAAWLGVTGHLAPFSVRAEITGLDIQAFGTVVDNLTGDSVLYLSSFQDENRIWLAGVASLSGVNNSQWRTDLWLYNPTGDWLPAGDMEYVIGDSPDESPEPIELPTLSTHFTKQYLDIVSRTLELEETRGYIVLTGAAGGPAPQVAARTYNLDPSGGTYGLNLRAFGSKDLLQPGETGYIVGISNSSNLSVGFRTNVGVLNTDRNGWTTVRLTMYHLDGSQAADPYETTIAPGKLRQLDIFKKLGLGDTDMTGSLVIEAVSGGAVAVYATEIDNRTQDSIFIPAQRRFMGLAR